jgi:hypothetical protein
LAPAKCIVSPMAARGTPLYYYRVAREPLFCSTSTNKLKKKTSKTQLLGNHITQLCDNAITTKYTDVPKLTCWRLTYVRVRINTHRTHVYNFRPWWQP